MRTRICATLFFFALATGAVNFAQQGTRAAPAGQGQGGRGGRGGWQQAAPQVPSVSKRPNGGGLATIRMGAPDNNMWFGWRVAMPTAALKGMTFSDALAKADVIPFASVEASSTQITSFEVPKPLDQRLQANERAAVVYRLREIAESIVAYRVDTIGADPAMRRRVFEFARSINVPLVITSADTANLAELDKLAEEFEINVALESKGDPKIRDGRARRPQQAAGRQRASRRLGAGRHQGGGRPCDREGQAAARDGLRPERARRAGPRRVAGRGRGGSSAISSWRSTGRASSRCPLPWSRPARPKPT